MIYTNISERLDELVANRNRIWNPPILQQPINTSNNYIHHNGCREIYHTLQMLNQVATEIVSTYSRKKDAVNDCSSIYSVACSSNLTTCYDDGSSFDDKHEDFDAIYKDNPLIVANELSRDNITDIYQHRQTLRLSSLTTQATLSEEENDCTDYKKNKHSNNQTKNAVEKNLFPGIAFPAGVEATDAMRERYEPVRIELFRKIKMCPWYGKDLCRMEDCNYAHSPLELRGWPDFKLGKPKLCPSLIMDYDCQPRCRLLHNPCMVSRRNDAPAPGIQVNRDNGDDKCTFGGYKNKNRKQKNYQKRSRFNAY